MPIINTYIGSKKPEAITITPDAQTAAVTPASVLTSGTYINISKGYNSSTATYQVPSGGTIYGDAAPGDVVAGRTFMSASSTTVQTGTMPSSSPVTNTYGYQSDGILTPGTQIHIPGGYYYRDWTYTAPSTGVITEAYIDIEDNWSAGFGRYVRDPSNDLDNRYAWTINTGETPISSDYTGDTYYTVWTMSDTPSSGDYLYSNITGVWDYVDYSMSSVLVGAYHPAQGGWTSWTHLSNLSDYIYIKWIGSDDSSALTEHKFDAFYSSDSSAHQGSLYYGGLYTSNAQNIEDEHFPSVSVNNQPWARVAGDYSMKSYTGGLGGAQYMGYWHFAGQSSNGTQNNPLTLNIIGCMSSVDYIRIKTTFTGGYQKSDDVESDSFCNYIDLNSYLFGQDVHSVTLQFYNVSSNVYYRYKINS